MVNGSDGLRCLTMTQPWASLVAVGAKRWETRDWKPTALGPLAIRSGINLDPAGGPDGLAAMCAREPFASALAAAGLDARTLPLGVVLCVVDVVDVQPTDGLFGIPDEPERSFGDYAPRRWMWQLENLRPLHAPIACDGQPGLPPLPEDTTRLVLDQASACSSA